MHLWIIVDNQSRSYRLARGPEKQLIKKNSDASIYRTLLRSADCLNLNENYQVAYYQKTGSYIAVPCLLRACERSVSGRFAAPRSTQAIFVTPALRSGPPSPRFAPAQAFSGMSAHRSAPAYPIFCALRSHFPLRSLCLVRTWFPLDFSLFNCIVIII